MREHICPHCHQTIGAMRLGVRMTPLKAAIVDRIKAAGDIGVSSDEIIADLYRPSIGSRHDDQGPCRPDQRFSACH
jgi:hypothetical protein